MSVRIQVDLASGAPRPSRSERQVTPAGLDDAQILDVVRGALMATRDRTP